MIDRLGTINGQVFSVLDSELWDECWREYYFPLWLRITNNTGQQINNETHLNLLSFCDE